MKTPRVAIIGAGLAGLCTARRFALAKPTLDFVVFEKQSYLGGVWVYDETDTSSYWFHSNDFLKKTSRGIDPSKNRDDFNSCIYKNLRTNLPKELMKIPGFDYSSLPHSYVSHNEVLQNIQQFSNHFELNKFIKYNQAVKNVEKISDGNHQDSWSVTCEDQINGKTKTEIFDAVVVCNGHFEVPIYPNINGISHFKGLMLHSRYYRDPSSFAGKNIIVVGAGASGLDISIDLSTKANQILISHSKSTGIESDLPNNVQEYPLIDYINESGHIVFENGMEYNADVILFCTGYQLDFPFLGKSCNVKVIDNTLLNLYYHIFHIDHPSLSFIGINCKIIPAQIFDTQAQSVLEVIQKRTILPPRKVMKEHTDQEIQHKDNVGVPRHLFHTLGKDAWSYTDNLVKEFNCLPTPTVIIELAKFTQSDRSKNLLTYRNKNYETINSDTFKLLD